MCLKIKKGEVEKTATEDIVVYKIINMHNNSLYQGFQYKPNRLYRLRKKLKVKRNEIYEGFHSYNCLVKVRDNILETFLNPKVVKFVIPKGAKYYLGRDNDIVSTSIRSGNLKNIEV